MLSDPSLSLIILLVGGFIAGFYGSSVGSGSLVSFPALLLIGLPTHLAIATNRFAVIFAEATSAIQFKRHGKLDVRFAILLGLIEATGAVIGSRLVFSVSENTLNIIVAAFLLLVPLVIFAKPTLGVKDGTLSRKKKVMIAVIGFPIGVYGGFFGASHGTLLLMALTFGGLSLIQCAAIARMAGFFVASAATISFISMNAVLYREGLVLGAGYAVGSWFGVRTSIQKGNGYVRALLLTVAFLSAGKLILQTL